MTTYTSPPSTPPPLYTHTKRKKKEKKPKSNLISVNLKLEYCTITLFDEEIYRKMIVRVFCVCVRDVSW